MESLEVTGLTADQIASSRSEHGANVLSSQKPPSPFKRVIGIIKEPMFLLLIAAGLVSLVLAEPIDAAVLLLMVFTFCISAFLGITAIAD